MVYRILALGCAGIWIILELRISRKMTKQEIVFALFLLLVCGVSWIKTNSISGILSQISVILLFISTIMVNRYSQRTTELRIIPVIVAILFIIWNICTIKEMAINHQIARIMAHDNESIYELMKRGIGGYGLIYPQVCIFPLMLSWTFTSKSVNNRNFVIGCVWVVSYIILIMRAGFSIAIACTIVSIIVLLLYKGKSPVIALLISLGVFGALILALSVFPQFRDLVTQLFGHTAVENKIGDLMTFTAAQDPTSTIGLRIRKYGISFNYFTSYPLTGALWWQDVGGHSSILDMFGQYGLFGGVIYICMIIHVPLVFNRKYKDPFSLRLGNALFVSILFVAMFDSLPYQIMMTISVIALAMIEDIHNCKALKDELQLNSKNHPERLYHNVKNVPHSDKLTRRKNDYYR